MKQTSLKIKALPNSPEADLEPIKKEIKENLEASGAIEIKRIDEQSIAFGLKALIITIIWPENQETDKAQQAIEKAENIKSTQVEDYRLIS